MCAAADREILEAVLDGWGDGGPIGDLPCFVVPVVLGGCAATHLGFRVVR